MRFTSRLFVALLLTVSCAVGLSQAKLNPATQINWQGLTGNGVPTTVCPSSTITVGTPYDDVTNNVPYVCLSGGWEALTLGATYNSGAEPVLNGTDPYSTNAAQYSIVSPLKFTTLGMVLGVRLTSPTMTCPGLDGDSADFSNGRGTGAIGTIRCTGGILTSVVMTANGVGYIGNFDVMASGTLIGNAVLTPYFLGLRADTLSQLMINSGMISAPLVSVDSTGKPFPIAIGDGLTMTTGTSGSVAAVTLPYGFYTFGGAASTPITFSGGGGSGAAGTFNVDCTWAHRTPCVSSVVITSGGSGYTSTPTATVEGMSLGVTMTTIPKLMVTAGSGLPSGVVADGADGLAVTGGISAASTAAQAIGGSRYPSQYGDKSTNGIVTAAAGANNQRVIVDPSYPDTELPSPLSFSASPFHYQDQRLGTTIDYYHNSYRTGGWFPFGNLSNTGTYGNVSSSSSNTFCLQDANPTSWGATNAHNVCHSLASMYNAPGWSLGNPGGFGAGAGAGWASVFSLAIGGEVRGSALQNTIVGTTHHYGLGDNILMDVWAYGEGGNTAGSDEANKLLDGNVVEDTDFFTGTCATGCTTGSTLIKTTVTNPKQGVGRYLIDHTAGASYTGHATVVAAGLGTASAVTTDFAVPVSNAWGTITSGSINTPVNTQGSFTTSETFNVSAGNYISGASVTGSATQTCSLSSFTGYPGVTGTVALTGTNSLSAGSVLTLNTPGSTSGITTATMGSGTATCSGTVVVSISGTFDTTKLACFAGNFHEQAIPTAVGTASGSGQSVTISLRRPHVSNSYVFQGGVCGSGLEFPAWTWGNRQYTFDVIGSTGDHTLQAVAFAYSGSSSIPQQSSGNFPYLNQCANTGTLSSSGTTVTTAWNSAACSGGTLGQPYQYNTGSVIFTSVVGDTDGVFTNAICTNLSITGTGNGSAMTCTIAGLTSTHSATSSTFALAQNGVQVNSISLMPIAEVLDVQNESLSPPQIDGTFALEPNNIQFAPGPPGDTIWETHHYSSRWAGATVGAIPQNPYSQNNFGADFGLAGKGATGGGTSLTANTVLQLSNGEPESTFPQGGPLMTPANMMTLIGPYYIGLDFGDGPRNGQAVLYVRTKGSQSSDPTYGYRVWQSDNYGVGSNNSSLAYTPYTDAVTLSSANGPVSVYGGGGTTVGKSGQTTTFPSGSTVTMAGTTLTLPNSGVTAGSYTNVTVATDGRVTAGSNSAPNAAQFSQVAVGALQNYVKNSATMSGTGWSILQGTPTITTGQTDPTVVGTHAVRLDIVYGDIYLNTSGSSLVNGNTYNVCGYMKGATGAEAVQVGVGNVTAPYFNLTSSWKLFSGQVTVGATYLTHTMSFASTGAAETFYIYGWNLTDANTTCLSPGIQTGNNTVTTPSDMVEAPLIDSASYTLNGVAEGAANGIPGPLNSSGTLPLTQQCTGTPAAGKYCDGGTGAWATVTAIGALPVVVAHVSLTNQSTAQTILTYTPTADGFYRVSAEEYVATGCTSGNITVSVTFQNFTNHAGAFNAANGSCAATAAYNGVVVLHATANTAINVSMTFSGTIGTPSYYVDAVIEQIQ